MKLIKTDFPSNRVACDLVLYYLGDVLSLVVRGPGRGLLWCCDWSSVFVRMFVTLASLQPNTRIVI